MQNISELILLKNNQFIACNKPATMAVQGDQSGDKSLLDLTEIYAHKTIYPLNRLDRPASGVVLFGNTPRAAASINEQFKNRTVTKDYLAIVANKPKAESGQLVHYIKTSKNGNKSIIVEQGTANSKEAILDYNYLGSTERYHLLHIKLHTGRHHQIRVQLAEMGCPIKGDVKYGFRRKNKDRSIHLHAWKLGLNHPVTNEKIEIEAPIPDDPVWNACAEFLKK